MRAAFVEDPGPPESVRVGELPDPTPGPGQVRVRVHATSVNPIDVYHRAGLVKAALPRPYIPGADFAGVVDAVGPGTTRFAAGDRVWGSNQGLLGRQGTLAEFCCVDEPFVYPLPAGVGFGQAAAAALVGITAHLGLFSKARLQPGEVVFVNGGTGGVGEMVVQMARAAGARVIATAGSDDKARRLDGAASVGVNYRTGDLPGTVRDFTSGRGVDVWFETQPPTDLDRTVELTAPNGRIVLMAGRAARPVLPNGAFYTKGQSIFGFAMFNVPPAVQADAATALAGWLASGTVRPTVGATFPLADAAAAHRLQEDNTLGKAGTLSGKIVVDVRSHSP